MQAEADQILEQISQIRESIQYDNQNLYYRENNGNITKAKSLSSAPSHPLLRERVGVRGQSNGSDIMLLAVDDVLEGAEAFAGAKLEQ